jgi:EamA domain-containing membrane protein RarD
MVCRMSDKKKIQNNNHKKMDSSEFVRGLLLIMVFGLINLVPAGYFLISGNRIHTSSIGALDFFNKFSESGSQIRMN